MAHFHTELLVLRDPPTLAGVTSSSVDVKWTEWRKGIDAGDPPLVAYVVYVKTATGEWREAKTVSSTVSTTNVRGLEEDTDYEFSVAAAREGEGGTGPRSGATVAITLCGSRWRYMTFQKRNISSICLKRIHLK